MTTFFLYINGLQVDYSREFDEIDGYYQRLTTNTNEHIKLTAVASGYPPLAYTVKERRATKGVAR
jgi:hypothetical protein